jgi:integrase
MAQSAPARTKINTKVTQPAPGRPSRRPAGWPGPGRPPRGPRVSRDARESVRQSARPVIELDFGILVYPPETGEEPWRAVFTENGQRRFRQGATEAKLAEKLEKVRERLQADAANMERPGADLIRHYLDPDRLPAQDRWSRKHAHTQRRLCERFAAPVIGAVACHQAGRVISVDRQVIEVAGHLYTEAPKCRKYRKTIYPRRTPDGYPLAEKLAARIEQATAEHEAGTNPPGLIFPLPTGKHWRSSNFNRNVLQRAYLAIGWRDADGNGKWTWHSLRHVFCTTALFTWKLDPTDVSCMAGHANVRTTLLMYVGSTAGVLDRARQATD